MNPILTDVRALLSGPVAMHPARLRNVIDAVLAEARGEDVDLRAMLAFDSQRRDRTTSTGQGVAVMEISGAILYRSRWWPTSTERLGVEFDRLLDDDAIETIILDVQSPGGTVYGVAEFAKKVFAARKRKRIIAVANPLAASAAYWIGTAAGELVVIPSGEVGSVGVFAVHLEFSRLLEAEGITATVIRAGEHKAEGNVFEPLSPEAREHMQSQIDVYYDAFVRAVARHRGISAARVLRDFGQGRTALAEEAVEIGMADRVATLEEVLVEVGVDRRRQIGMHAEAPAAAPTAAAAAASDPGNATAAAVGPLVRDRELERIAASPGPGVRVFPAAVDPPEDEEEDEDDEDPVEDPEDDVDPNGEGSTSSSESPEPEAASEAREEAVDPTQEAAARNGAATEPAAPAVQVGADREAEATRSAQIAELCALHGISDKAADYIRSGRSVADIGLEIARTARENLKAMTTPVVDMTDREVKRYSIRRAIMGQVARREGSKPIEDDGFEREISAEIEKKLPKDYKYQGGIMVPTRIAARDAHAMGFSLGARIDPALIQRISVIDPSLAGRLAALDTSVTGGVGGGNTVFTEGGELIDMLRPRMRVIALGATTLTGLRSPIGFPRQTGASQWTWVPENPGADVPDTDAVIGQVLLSPKSGSASTAYSRQLLTESSIDVDAFVQNDLNQIAALGIDKAAIDGPSGGDSPVGILNTTGVNVVEIGTNGGPPTFVHVVQLETEIATDNADIGTLAYLTTPGVRGKLKTTEMFPGTNGMPIWMGGEVNGYRAEVSTQVPSNLTKGTGTNLHAILFGVWSQLLLGYFGAYELIVDPFRLKKQALIEVTAFQMVGTAVRNPESFAVIEDASIL
ncbi:MAG TPA: phage major capsid protein [Longimicrobiales bacterium]